MWLIETAAELALAELEIKRLATVVVELEARIMDIIFVVCVCCVGLGVRCGYLFVCSWIEEALIWGSSVRKRVCCCCCGS